MSDMVNNIESRIELFNEQKSKFKNYPLLTELPNSDTLNLSALSQNDLNAAIKLLISVDKKALQELLHEEKLKEFYILQKEVLNTFNRGKKLFICGCGASGRLAVFLEYIWRKYYSDDDSMDSVVGVLAGGDNALIKSIEGFEDHEEYGKKQLEIAGFTPGDFLLAISASGESPFVIGAAKMALEIGSKVYFIHCNTNDALIGRKNNRLFNRDNIYFLSLYTVPMALTGSTRMQATTVLTICVALALMEFDISFEIKSFIKILESLDTSGLKSLIEKESEIYGKDEFILFDTYKDYGITVLTDTTERSPTFNLLPFENQLSKNKKASWSYLLFSEVEDSESAWEKLLNRKPRTLNWNEETDLKTLYGFDFSKRLIDLRAKYTGKMPIFYRISKEDGILTLALDGVTKSINISNLNPLFEQLVLKIIMNTCSTLVMGRLGFYEGNLMTSVNPSNSKLIDRAIRYVDFILREKYNKSVMYDEISLVIFEEMKILKEKESIVLKTVNRFLQSMP